MSIKYFKITVIYNITISILIHNLYISNIYILTTKINLIKCTSKKSTCLFYLYWLLMCGVNANDLYLVELPMACVLLPGNISVLCGLSQGDITLANVLKSKV